MTEQQLSGNWANNLLGDGWTVETARKGVATVRSRWFSAQGRGIHLARECVLTVPGKFFAETLLVYPQTTGNFPIFGSEYIRMARGSFGAVDFHPVQVGNNAIPADFDHYPPRTVAKSPHYDLDRHFSPVLWHKKAPEDFYGEFAEVAEGRLRRYLAVLDQYEADVTTDTGQFTPFDTYMAVHDPARGILKAYFGENFANDYIQRFLFPHSGCNSELGHVQGDQAEGLGAVSVLGPGPGRVEHASKQDGG